MIPLKTIEELISKHSLLEKDLSSGKMDKKLLREEVAAGRLAIHKSLSFGEVND